MDPEDWFAAVAEQSRRLTDALVAEGRPADAVRRSAQFGLEMCWPFENRSRYADTLGRLVEAGVDEGSVHWPRPDGRGLPAGALSLVADAHGL